MQRTAVQMVVLTLCVSAVTVTGMRAGAGPFDAQLSGRALQRQRELDFVASSLRYLTEEARDDAAERSRVMGILTGGFAVNQLADAVCGLTTPPASAGGVDRAEFAARAEVVRRLLTHVRAVEPPVRYEDITMAKAEGVGLYVEIDGRAYSGEDALEMYCELSRRLQITAAWDAIERRLHKLEQAIADLPEPTD